jgi:hypothetical protein
MCPNLSDQSVSNAVSTNAPQLKSVNLIWEGPYTFKELLWSNKSDEYKKNFNCSGVYLWHLEGSDRPDYVGKSAGNPSLWLRQFHHYLFQIGGSYTIPAGFTVAKKKWTCDHQDSNVMDTIFDENSFKEVISDGFRYATAIRICIAKLPRHQVKDAERNLLFNLKPYMTLWGTKTQPDISLAIRHDCTRCRMLNAGSCTYFKPI